MKMPFVSVLTFVLIGCASSQPGSLTAKQASTLAIRLANDQAATAYHCEPFHDDQSAQFVAGHWLWTARQGYGQGDIQATVQLAADGSTNNVVMSLVSNLNIN